MKTENNNNEETWFSDWEPTFVNVKGGNSNGIG